MKSTHPSADKVIAQVGIQRNVMVGDIIPAAWWSTIVEGQGRPHYVAIVLLADILWRYTLLKDGKRKFDLRYYALNRKQTMKKLNVTSKAISRALTFLESKNLIRSIPVNVVTRGAVTTGTLLVYPIVETVAKYSVKPKKTGTGETCNDGDGLDSSGENDGDSLAPVTGTGEARGQGQAGSVSVDSQGSHSVTEIVNDIEVTQTLGDAAPGSPPAPHLGDLPMASPVTTPQASPSQLIPSADLPDDSPEAQLGNFWTKARRIRFDVDQPLSEVDQKALKKYFARKGHWRALSLAVLALIAWSLMNARNKTNGYSYHYCKRSNNLGYFLEHVDNIATDCDFVGRNTAPVRERVRSLLEKLDNLNGGDKEASDTIVAECFPEPWISYQESQ